MVWASVCITLIARGWSVRFATSKDGGDSWAASRCVMWGLASIWSPVLFWHKDASTLYLFYSESRKARSTGGDIKYVTTKDLQNWTTPVTILTHEADGEVSRDDDDAQAGEPSPSCMAATNVWTCTGAQGFGEQAHHRQVSTPSPMPVGLFLDRPCWEAGHELALHEAVSFVPGMAQRTSRSTDNRRASTRSLRRARMVSRPAIRGPSSHRPVPLPRARPRLRACCGRRMACGLGRRWESSRSDPCTSRCGMQCCT